MRHHKHHLRNECRHSLGNALDKRHDDLHTRVHDLRKERHKSADQFRNDLQNDRHERRNRPDDALRKSGNDGRRALKHSRRDGGDQLNRLRYHTADGFNHTRDAVLDFFPGLLVSGNKVGKTVHDLRDAWEQFPDHAVLKSAKRTLQFCKTVLESGGGCHGFIAHDHAVVLRFLL